MDAELSDFKIPDFEDSDKNHDHSYDDLGDYPKPESLPSSIGDCEPTSSHSSDQDSTSSSDDGASETKDPSSSDDDMEIDDPSSSDDDSESESSSSSEDGSESETSSATEDSESTSIPLSNAQKLIKEFFEAERQDLKDHVKKAKEVLKMEKKRNRAIKRGTDYGPEEDEYSEQRGFAYEEQMGNELAFEEDLTCDISEYEGLLGGIAESRHEAMQQVHDPRYCDNYYSEWEKDLVKGCFLDPILERKRWFFPRELARGYGWCERFAAGQIYDR